MFCPQCRAEYPERSSECPECHVPLADYLSEPDAPPGLPPEAQDLAGESDLNVLIQTCLGDPIAVGLVKSLLQEAGIPFFVMDQNPAARQESGNFLGWWNVRVPREREAEAREFLQSVEEMG